MDQEDIGDGDGDGDGDGNEAVTSPTGPIPTGTIGPPVTLFLSVVVHWWG